MLNFVNGFFPKKKGAPPPFTPRLRPHDFEQFVRFWIIFGSERVNNY